MNFGSSTHSSLSKRHNPILMGLTSLLILLDIIVTLFISIQMAIEYSLTS